MTKGVVESFNVVDEQHWPDHQVIQYSDQINFIVDTLKRVFKLELKDAFEHSKLTRKGDLVILEVKSAVRDLVPALDIKLIGFQSKKKIGCKVGDLVVVLREVKNGKDTEKASS